MRNPVFDIMKGIGILAMILGHSPIPKILISFIFTWHMPLFFIISGYFFHPISVVDCIRSNSRSLLVPYLVTMLFIIVLYLFIGNTQHNSLLQALCAIFIGAGSRNLPMLQDFYVGALWFLQALFWSKVLFSFLNSILSDQLRPFVILAVSSIATYIGQYVFIPTNLLQGASALVFYEIGYQINVKSFLNRNYNRYLLLFFLLLMCVSMHSGSMSIVRCYYGFYPVNVICAASFFIFCYYLSTSLIKYKKVLNVLSYLGRISLVILCVHIVDLFFKFNTLLNNSILHLYGVEERLFNIVWRVLFAVVLSCFLVRIKLISRLFRITS